LPTASSATPVDGIAAGSACAALLVGFLLYRRRKTAAQLATAQKRRGRGSGGALAPPLAAPLLSGGGGGGGGGDAPRSPSPHALSFRPVDILRATGNFAARRKLAQGAFGAVYRGELRDGRVVAIKVLTRLDDPDAAPSEYSGENSFALEAKVLGQYQHPNIVVLLGHCTGSSSRAPQEYLVFEFMAGGSLYDRLDPAGATPLSWPLRFAIASDVARGLVYLHRASPPIIHQDVKSENILLGEYQGQLVAKIADFGAVRIAPTLVKSTHLSAASVIGTKPYQPPEYINQGHVSEKTDAYAFGVVLLELLTSRPPSSEENGGAFLAMELAPALDAPERLMPFDTRAGACPREHALQMACIARKCLEMYVHKRSTLHDVLGGLDALAGRRAASSGQRRAR
jgi:serine/threonine protein kinase